MEVSSGTQVLHWLFQNSGERRPQTYYNSGLVLLLRNIEKNGNRDEKEIRI
jgi:hypothetical protein